MSSIAHTVIPVVCVWDCSFRSEGKWLVISCDIHRHRKLPYTMSNDWSIFLCIVYPKLAAGPQGSDGRHSQPDLETPRVKPFPASEQYSSRLWVSNWTFEHFHLPNIKKILNEQTHMNKQTLHVKKRGSSYPNLFYDVLVFIYPGFVFCFFKYRKYSV